MWSELGLYDEYGNTITTSETLHSGALPYGWLGGKERATDVSGLMLMGVRLYNSVTGQFTSVDPIVGGNSTAYAYPQDPINHYDLDGNASWWSRNWKKVAVAAAVVVAVGVTCYFASATCGAAVRVGAKVVQRVATKVAQRQVQRHIAKGTLRYGKNAVKTGNASRSYQRSTWAQKQIVKYGKRSFDPREKGYVRFEAEGSHNGRQGMFRMVIHPKTGEVRHFGFHSSK